ncbi:hypothetical protein ACIRL0_05030 [Streptomyces sp. NPDC102365]|jgi:hypothetical protein
MQRTDMQRTTTTVAEAEPGVLAPNVLGSVHRHIAPAREHV